QNRRHESVASRIFLARGIDRARDLLPAQQPQLVVLVARRSGLAADIDRARRVAHPPPGPNLRETRSRDEDQVPQLLLARGSDPRRRVRPARELGPGTARAPRPAGRSMAADTDRDRAGAPCPARTPGSRG